MTGTIETFVVTGAMLAMSEGVILQLGVLVGQSLIVRYGG
ncbi:MAG: hypothetical protein ETSY1_18570 [Candidatus Entotheonella factor]|uniref:Uncharacterized protein n=1 Tax=Entotheonella factor TaxID=1429438 RepID=W4LK60_ENTF1|nr:MAG: hypothetical protein ETSY1_18570 [Candidatus Entotheonella factor]